MVDNPFLQFFLYFPGLLDHQKLILFITNRSKDFYKRNYAQFGYFANCISFLVYNVKIVNHWS